MTEETRHAAHELSLAHCTHQARWGNRHCSRRSTALALTASPVHALIGEGTVTRSAGQVTYVSGSAVNRVGIAVQADGQLGVTDLAGVDGFAGCTNVNERFATCGTGVTSLGVTLNQGNDDLTMEAALLTQVRGGDAGNRVKLVRIPGTSQLSFFGGPGFDTVDYGSSDRFVTVTINGVAGDGRPGDQDNIQTDVENVVGSPFPDQITGSTVSNLLDGGLGADVLNGAGGDDRIAQANRSDGADQITGGSGSDSVDYSLRSGGVVVSLNAVADDGSPGELDKVAADVEVVLGSAGVDTLTGNGAANTLRGAGSGDLIRGLAEADLLDGGAGRDVLESGAGDDIVFARDSEADTVRCGTGADTAEVDQGLDTVVGCESLKVLR